MKVIIMGCGRVGEQVSRLMSAGGHSVAVIDQDPAALARLGADFHGQRVLGPGFDRRVLLEAGIEQADGFAATSSSDNANIIAARLARQVFQVPKVVARLFDPRRAEIYRRLGLVTISSTTWGAERIHELFTHGDLDPVHTFGSGEVCLLSVDAPVHLVGRTVANLAVPGEIIVAALTRDGQALLPTLGTQFRAGDVLHLMVLASAMPRLETLLDWSSSGGG
jgi:trk system potassium uptake protein TrkA